MRVLLRLLLLLLRHLSTYYYYYSIPPPQPWSLFFLLRHPFAMALTSYGNILTPSAGTQHSKRLPICNALNLGWDISSLSTALPPTALIWDWQPWREEGCWMEKWAAILLVFLIKTKPENPADPDITTATILPKVSDRQASHQGPRDSSFSFTSFVASARNRGRGKLGCPALWGTAQHSSLRGGRDKEEVTAGNVRWGYRARSSKNHSMTGLESPSASFQSSSIIFLFSGEGLAVPSLLGSSENAKSWQASRALSFPTNRTNTDERKISPSHPSAAE